MISNTHNGLSKFLNFFLCLLILVAPFMSPLQPATASTVIQVPDPYLNQAVRAALNKPSGDLTAEDMLGLTKIDAMNVKDLAGIQYALNLQDLRISGSSVKNLGPVAALSKLKYFYFNTSGQITDFSPLSRLVSLEELGIHYLDLDNLYFVSNMPNLSFLSIMGCQVTDLTPLLSLPKLSALDIRDNPLDLTQSQNIEALKKKGVWMWTTPLQPPTLFGEMKDFTQLGAGCRFTVGLKKDGTVWAWGVNSGFQLGAGTSRSRSVPSLVYGLDNVAKIYVGETKTYVQKKDGSIWTWGSGYDGTGKAVDDPYKSPYEFQNLTGVVKLAVGNGRVFAIKNDGTVWAWGENDLGLIGDGTKTDRLAPVQIDGLTDIVDISCGVFHNAAVKADGTVWTWGYNYLGQLGRGTISQYSPLYLPAKVPGLTGVKAVACGDYHTIVLKTDGTVYGWGWNIVGQVGDGTTVDRGIPVKIPDLAGIKKISASDYQSAALGQNGLVWCWGSNASGQSGPDSAYIKDYAGDMTPYNPSPYLNPHVGYATDISAGSYHTVALEENGTVSSWGYSFDGQLGMVNPEYSTSVSSIQSFPITWDEKLKTLNTYDVEYKEANSSRWNRLKTKTNLKNTTFAAGTGKTYLFRIRGWDKKGSNNWYYSPKKSTVPFDNDNLISGKKGFNSLAKVSGAFNGTLRYSTKANESITYRVTGKKVSLITTKGKGQSKAKVYVDGVYRATIDGYSSTTKYRQIIFSQGWKTRGTHTVTVVNQGTRGRARFDIDALAVIN